ncbi:MAG: hypothetical protein AB1668_05325 [Nanoarchaeota archaeon]
MIVKGYKVWIALFVLLLALLIFVLTMLSLFIVLLPLILIVIIVVYAYKFLSGFKRKKHRRKDVIDVEYKVKD